MRYDSSEDDNRRLPAYVRAWFYLVVVVGLLYAGTSLALPVIERQLEERYSSPVKVAYAWVGEDGVPHYSNVKKTPSAEEVVVVDEPDGERIKLFEADVLIQLRKYRPLLEKGFFSLWVMAGAFVIGAAGLSLGRSLKRKFALRAFRKALHTGLRDLDDLEASVSLNAEVGDFREKLDRARATLDKITKSAHADESYHREVAWALGRALQVYADCAALWDVTSQRELTSPENKGYLWEYPVLLDRTTGHEAPLPPESARRAVRRTLMGYASYYVAQAREMHSKSKDREPSK
jgi:hypothetical protein